MTEDVIAPWLDAWLASLFAPEHLDETCARLAAASGAGEAEGAKVEAARRAVDDCDRRLKRYRAALDSGADPTAVTSWIRESQGEKLAAQRVLAETNPQLTTAEEICEGLGDVTAVLADADPATKAKAYRDTLGLRLVYVSDEAKVLVTRPAPRGMCQRLCRRGDLNSAFSRAAWFCCVLVRPALPGVSRPRHSAEYRCDPACIGPFSRAVMTR